MKNKIFTILALLCLTATGAWALPAQNYLYLEVDGTSATVKYGDKGTKPYYGSDPNDPSSYGWYAPMNESMPDYITNYTGKNSLTTVTIDASCQNYTGTTLDRFFDFWTSLTTINNLENLNMSEVTNMRRMFAACRSMTSFDFISGWNTAKVTNMNSMFNGVSVETLDLSGFNTSSVTDMYCMFYNCSNLKNIYVGDGWSTASVTNGDLMFGKCTNLPGFDSGKVTHEMAKLTTDGGYLTYKAPGIDLTLNADSTVVTIEEMPAYDLTVDYELVRDMSVDMTVSVEDAQGKSSIRLKKMENGKYQPADMTPQQMAGLITVTDDIEQQELTNNTDYTVSIFAVDDNDQPTGTAIAFADLTPGRYVAFATAKEGTIYDGQTLPSNIFKLFVGYEVEVEAGQYATFYKDENLKLAEDTENAELRTITSVEADRAIVGGDFTIAPKLTPLIVHNTADVKQTILLIPTEEHPDEVQFASQFMGTLDGTTLPVATNTKTSYALNGTNFVWVKYQPLEVPANKCWLEVTNAAGVKAITLVDEDDATGIESLTPALSEGEWYDLNGRKIQTPKQRGIYINNGRKVVVK